MEIATEHPKCQRIRTRHHMEERLLFDRVTLQRTYITPWHAQFSTLIKTYLTDAALSLWYLTSVAAGITSHRVIRHTLVESPLHSHSIQDIA
jgi:hypothetical protein